MCATKICDYRYNRVSVFLEKVSSQSRGIMCSWLFRTRDQTLTSYRKNRMNTICPAPRRLGSFVVQSRVQRNRTGHGPSPWPARIYSLSRNEILSEVNPLLLSWNRMESKLPFIRYQFLGEYFRLTSLGSPLAFTASPPCLILNRHEFFFFFYKLLYSVFFFQRINLIAVWSSRACALCSMSNVICMSAERHFSRDRILKIYPSPKNSGNNIHCQ